MSRFPSLDVKLIVLFALALCTSLASAQNVVFHKRATQAGDVSRQQLTCDLALDMKLTQGGQLIDSRQQNVQRKQVRQLTIQSIGKDVPTSAVISYLESEIQLTQPEQPPYSEKQPVAGKSYKVERQGKELIVLDPEGNVPPPAELEIVKANLDTFGLPNPIAKFFDGTEMRVGQTISLPLELARELLGFSETVGDVSELKMTLVRTRKIGEANCAEFKTNLVAKSVQAAGVQIELTGSIVLEIDTCRTVAVALKGPVEVSETHGPAEASFHVTSSGMLEVAVRAEHSRVAKTASGKSTPTR